jgi:hypothetical protein
VPEIGGRAALGDGERGNMPIVREEETARKLATEVRKSIRSKKCVSKRYQKVLADIENDARLYVKPPIPRFSLKPGTDYKKALESAQKAYKKSAATRVRRNAKRLRDLVENAPKYTNGAFKCMVDFDKCRLHRGEGELICALAFTLCMIKNGGSTLVSTITKATKVATTGT